MQTLSHRRAAANTAASRQGIPTAQAGVDAMWGEIVSRHNASVPSTPSEGRTSPRPARTPQGQVDVDAMWSSLAADLNKKAGLKTPVMDRAR